MTDTRHAVHPSPVGAFLVAMGICLMVAGCGSGRRSVEETDAKIAV